MNNPFDYEPSARMLEAQQTLVAHIESLCCNDKLFAADARKGKMFGILLAQKKDPSAESVMLYGFSGQIGGSFVWTGFVPPVFDYLDEQGYFKVHEREITALNRRITELENSENLAKAKQELLQVSSKAEDDINAYKQLIKEAKAKRDAMRTENPESEAELIRESQFMKAELHRKKLSWREKIAEATSKVDVLMGDIRLMKLQRQQQSDALQRWLFEQFVFDGKSLMQIFAPEIPPSGAGECCEPKLLNYALEHNLEPIEIGMFWWGESPKQEIRHHLQFYPACNGKCKPIIENLIFVSLPPLYRRGLGRGFTVVFEDDWIIVVNKSASMLSVPGKSDAESVFSLLKATHPDCEELAMVHRLDMDTSGLLVVAKTKPAHKHLQRQFAEHTIEKEYVALLTKPLQQESGTINLPLRPDYNDRPRQMVDKANGKEAITKFYTIHSPLFVGEGLGVRLFPLTGRTHQLRVHCAHPEGLNNPIKGDRLYGKRADRLYLHAAKLTFTHPQTGERITFQTTPDF